MTHRSTPTRFPRELLRENSFQKSVDANAPRNDAAFLNYSPARPHQTIASIVRNRIDTKNHPCSAHFKNALFLKDSPPFRASRLSPLASRLPSSARLTPAPS